MNDRHEIAVTNTTARKTGHHRTVQSYGVWVIVGLATLSCGCFGLSRSPVCMPGAKIGQNGQCQAVESPVHRMPFRAGFKAKVTQGFHGYLSHKDDLSFSLDFKCQRGEPIVASRAGVVWDMRKNSDRGCGNRSCADQANFVILDHGDGTYTEYYHLQHWGSLVKKGQAVCAGQVVGLCGTTGFSTGPHLHFGVTDLARQTVPVRFQEATKPGTGFVAPDTTYVSRNRLEVSCDKVNYSSLQHHAFAHHGIVLDDPIPTYVEQKATKKTRISGAYYGRYKYVAINLKAVKGGKWSNLCVPVKNNRFDATIDWAKETKKQKGFFWFIVTGANKKCDGPGWAWSYKLQVQ